MKYVSQRISNAIKLLEKELDREKSHIENFKKTSASTDEKFTYEMSEYRMKVLNDELERLKRTFAS